MRSLEPRSAAQRDTILAPHSRAGHRGQPVRRAREARRRSDRVLLAAFRARDAPRTLSIRGKGAARPGSSGPPLAERPASVPHPSSKAHRQTPPDRAPSRAMIETDVALRPATRADAPADCCPVHRGGLSRRRFGDRGPSGVLRGPRPTGDRVGTQRRDPRLPRLHVAPRFEHDDSFIRIVAPVVDLTVRDRGIGRCSWPRRSDRLRAGSRVRREITAGHHRPAACHLYDSLGYDANLTAYLRKRSRPGGASPPPNGPDRQPDGRHVDARSRQLPPPPAAQRVADPDRPALGAAPGLVDGRPGRPARAADRPSRHLVRFCAGRGPADRPHEGAARDRPARVRGPPPSREAPLAQRSCRLRPGGAARRR